MTDWAAYMPDKYGRLDVVDLGMFLAAIDDGQDYDEAVTNAMFDSATAAEIEEWHGRKLYALNLTDDADAYWDRS